MGKNHIWIFNHYALTPDLPGGTRHYDFAKELVKRGYNVRIFASSFHYSLLKETKAYDGRKFICENHDGIDFVWIKTFSYSKNNWRRFINMRSYSLNASKAIRASNYEKPDIIIGSTVHPFAALTGYKMAKRYKVPFVFEIRDLWPQTFIDMGIWNRTDLRTKYFEYIERKLINRAAAVIALSPATENYLFEKYGYRNCFYIPNGVDVDQFDIRQSTCGDPSEDNKTLKYLAKLKTDDKMIFMFTGAIVLSNSIDVLINAARIIQSDGRNHQIKIVLIGSGQEKERCDRLIKESNLDNIVILEPVKKEFVPVLLSYADILLLIQGKVFWGSTNKLFDYLAAGKAIMTSVSCGHNDPVEEAGCGVSVPSDNPEALAEAIMAFCTMSEEEIKKMGEKSRAHAERYHSIPILADRLENMIRNIVHV